MLAPINLCQFMFPSLFTWTEALVDRSGGMTVMPESISEEGQFGV
jgi:hypothetical protein